MAEHENGGNRQTVAIVSEKIDGVKELVRAGFHDVQRQLNQLAGVPAQLAAQEAKIALLQSRVHDIEAGTAQKTSAFSGTLISLAMLALAAVNVYVIVKYGHSK